MLSDVFEVLAWGYCPGSLRVAGGAAATAVAAVVLGVFENVLPL